MEIVGVSPLFQTYLGIPNLILLNNKRVGTSCVSCENSGGKYMISDLMQVSLKDSSDTEKLQHPLRLNYVSSRLPFAPNSGN